MLLLGGVSRVHSQTELTLSSSRGHSPLPKTALSVSGLLPLCPGFGVLAEIKQGMERTSKLVLY